MDKSQIAQKEINHRIFREYDIRGIYNETLTDHNAYMIGKAFGSLLTQDNKLVTILRDGRHSSPNLAKNLTDGLVSSGARVIDLGIGPTPLLYFSNYNIQNVAAGIMVTGSHNPPSHNGFKILLDKKSFFGEDLQKLMRMIIENEIKDAEGEIVEYDSEAVKKEYLKLLVDNVNSNKKLKIAWDPGNGATGEVVRELCDKLDSEHIIINDVIDGNFPAHHPDPTVIENMQELISVVKNNNCDLGIGFDGDGDRIGVIDNKGRMIYGDQLISIYASQIVKDNPGRNIIADVKTSQNFFNLVNELGGNAIMWKTGHSLIKAKMKETNAIFAGEMSGHIFFADKYYGYDDGIYAAVRLIDILSNSDLLLSDLYDQLPKSFNTPEIRIDCSDDYKFEAIAKIKELLSKNNIEYIDIDGVRVNRPNGWWLIRASNTQAAIIARCEANSSKELEKLLNETKFYLKEININNLDI